MKFTKAINIWSLSKDQMKTLKPGQWVYAGDRSNLGRFYGVRSFSDTVVVAWKENAKNNDYFNYCNTLYTYAKG